MSEEELKADSAWFKSLGWFSNDLGRVGGLTFGAPKGATHFAKYHRQLEWAGGFDPNPQGTLLVREYEDTAAFQRDASVLSSKGWRVVSTTERTQNAGAARMAVLGFGAMVWKPKPHIVVTYERDGGPD